MMILNQNSNPDRQIYYLGARLLEIIPPNNPIVFFDAYQALQDIEKISMPLFLLIVDWLYLLGAIKLEQGQLLRCS